MHHISKNWERVFDFQYKVVIGQFDRDRVMEKPFGLYCHFVTSEIFCQIRGGKIQN